MTSTTPRRNRRANTDDLPVRDNRIFNVQTMRDGYRVRYITHYYRRNATAGYRYTGPAPMGSVHGHLTPRP